MLDRLRKRATRILAETHSCTLATMGPAGIQVSIAQCTGQGAILNVLVPDTSDHLFNLEIEREVAITTPMWQLRGYATIVEDATDLFSAEQRQWRRVVRITPTRLHILAVSERTTK